MVGSVRTCAEEQGRTLAPRTQTPRCRDCKILQHSRMDIPYLTAFGLLIVIPCLIALARTKETSNRTLLGLTAALAAIIALIPVADAIGDLINGNLLRALAVVTAVLAVITSVRIRDPATAALICTGGGFLAAQVFGILD